ncbi:sensor histidine kinase [uncultured Jatrophihabitans sp.]|uniref:sensor histidine kinase n=1 Tax=uncultured Jatrophihabitans sp. TaxID=1610747 RepID=UPI0035CA3DA7
MRLTARRRVLIALLVTWPFAFVWFGWMALIAYALTEHYRTGYASCGGGLNIINLPGVINGCDSVFSPGVAYVELVVMAAIAAVVAYAMARWVLAPVRAMAETVDRLGPTSLGLRLRQGGPADETRHLADAVDAMLDRVAEGYEAQRRFASTASHELRTPLATQRALIEVSLGSALSADQLELVSRQLLATNERNERLIDGLLTLAETERGLMSQQVQPFDRIVRDAVELQAAYAKERGVELRTELHPVAVRGELPLLERLVANLVQNAIKYNVEDGWVDVALDTSGVLTVVNSGPVVPADRVASLFEPFHRMSGERLDHGGGVGLGLTIARSIVAAHDGAVDARANPEGGLTVDVRLPGAR